MLCVLLGEQIEIGAANAEEFSIPLDCLRSSAACCKRSVRNGWGLRREHRIDGGLWPLMCCCLESPGWALA